MSNDDHIVIDTPEGIAFAQLLSFRGRLHIEINTGMRSRVNTLRAYNQRFGTSFKRRPAALADCEARIEAAKEAKHSGTTLNK